MNCAEKESRVLRTSRTHYGCDFDIDCLQHAYGSVRETVSVLFGWWHTAFYGRSCLPVESGLGTVGTATAGLGGVMVRTGAPRVGASPGQTLANVSIVNRNSDFLGVFSAVKEFLCSTRVARNRDVS